MLKSRLRASDLQMLPHVAAFRNPCRQSRKDPRRFAGCIALPMVGSSLRTETRMDWPETGLLHQSRRRRFPGDLTVPRFHFLICPLAYLHGRTAVSYTHLTLPTI